MMVIIIILNVTSCCCVVDFKKWAICFYVLLDRSNKQRLSERSSTALFASSLFQDDLGSRDRLPAVSCCPAPIRPSLTVFGRWLFFWTVAPPSERHRPHVEWTKKRSSWFPRSLDVGSRRARARHHITGNILRPRYFELLLYFAVGQFVNHMVQ